MKKMALIGTMSTVVASLWSSVFGGSVSEPYEVGLWKGFRQAAISYTLDDGTANQLPVAIPIFDEFGYDATLFTVTDWVGDWNALQQAAINGHEIASHTVTHARLNTLSGDNLIAELFNSKDAIETNIPGVQCLTIAYPNCRGGDVGVTSQYYIAGRGCSGLLESSTPADFYDIPAFICGSRGKINDVETFIATDNDAAAAQGWCVYLLHGIDNDGGYSPLSSTVLRGSLEYLQANDGIFWVATFSDVVKYIRERDAVTVTETAIADTMVTVTLTDGLADDIYHYPISLRRTLPAGWTSVVVRQNGVTLNSSVETVNQATIVFFDAVPDGGDVEIVKTAGGTAPAAPTGLTAIAGNAVVDLDWDDNTEADLNGYSVYRATAAGGPFARIVSDLTQSTYSDNGVVNNIAYYYKITATNDAGYESAFSNAATATPTDGSAPEYVSVASISIAWVAANGPQKKGEAVVVIKDSDGNPVSNIAVSGSFSGTLNEDRSGTTDQSGTVVIPTNAFTKSPGDLTFCVTGATHASLVYFPDANVESCDSAP